MKSAARFTVTLQAVPGDVYQRSPVQRLRAALKVLGRRFGLRCTALQKIESVEPSGERVQLFDAPTMPRAARTREADLSVFTNPPKENPHARVQEVPIV